jgi:hypothetical protein
LSLGGYPDQGGIAGPGDGYGGISDGKGGGNVVGANGGLIPNPNNPKNQLTMGGGGSGIAQQPAIDWSSVITPPRHGYESSSNKDFYQRQFQQQEGQQNAQKLKEFAAAMRAEQAAKAPVPTPQDPWSWANLPKVQTGSTRTVTPIEWGLNSNYGITPGMTNQQATGAVSSVLTPEEAAMMAQHWKDNPTGATQSNWVNSGSPNTLIGQLGGGISPEFTNTLQKVFNNIYTQTGGGTQGIAVPQGYANPVPQGA